MRSWCPARTTVYEESGEHTKETVYLKEIVKSKKK